MCPDALLKAAQVPPLVFVEFPSKPALREYRTMIIWNTDIVHLYSKTVQDFLDLAVGYDLFFILNEMIEGKTVQGKSI